MEHSSSSGTGRLGKATSVVTISNDQTRDSIVVQYARRGLAYYLFAAGTRNGKPVSALAKFYCDDEDRIDLDEISCPVGAGIGALLMFVITQIAHGLGKHRFHVRSGILEAWEHCVNAEWLHEVRERGEFYCSIDELEEGSEAWAMRKGWSVHPIANLTPHIVAQTGGTKPKKHKLRCVIQ